MLLFMMLVATIYVIGQKDKEVPFVCGTCLRLGEFDFTERYIHIQISGQGTTDYIPKAYNGYFVGTIQFGLTRKMGIR